MSVVVALSLLHFIWQGALIGAIAWIAIRLARSANARYLIGVAALVLMAVAPIATFQTMRVRQNAGKNAALGEQGGLPVGMRSNVQQNAGQNAGADGVGRPALQGRRSSDGQGADPDGVGRPALQGRRSFVEQNADAGLWTLDYMRQLVVVSPLLANWLLASWLVGVGLLSVRLSFGWWTARRLTRQSVRRPRADVLSSAERLITALRIRSAVRVLESALVQVPTVMGWLKPVVLLPASAMTGLSMAQIDALVAHELAHIKRHDYLVNLLQSAIETLLFYHPAVWLISQSVRHERELCCDDLAIAVCGDDRLTYASALADLESLRQVPAPALAANGGSLLTRVKRILAPDDVQTVRGRGHWMAGVAILSAALVMIAAQNVQGRQVAQGVVGGVPGGVSGGVQGGVAAGVPGGVPGGVVGSVQSQPLSTSDALRSLGYVAGGVNGGVVGGIPGGVVGGIDGGVAGGVLGGVSDRVEQQKIAAGQIIRLEVTVTQSANLTQRQRDLVIANAYSEHVKAQEAENAAAAQADRLGRINLRDIDTALDAANTVPGFNTDTVVIGYLNQIEDLTKGRKRMIAESHYGPRHSKIIAVDTDIAATQAQLQNRLKGLVDTARLNADVAKKSAERFKAEYDAQSAKPRSTAATVPVRDAELSKDYTVQEDGTILLPHAGKARAAGLTLTALQESLRVSLRAHGQKVVKVLASIEARAADRPVAAPAILAPIPAPPPAVQTPAAQASQPTTPSIEAPRNVPPKQVSAYVIGPADVVRVSVYSNGTSHTEFRGTDYRVQVDGSIALPLISPIKIAGLSVSQANAAIRKALIDAALFVDATVDITMMQFRSSSLRVQGAVRNPGNLEMTADRMNISDALNKAGGLQPAAGTKIRVKRAGGRPSAADIHVENGWEIYSRQDLDSGRLSDIQLFDGDTIDVPVAQKFFVTGFVKNPGEQQWEENVTLLQAITRAGGVTIDAAVNRVSVKRLDPATKKYELIQNAKMTMLILPDDIIEVPKRRF